jgi:hypothetical protein
MHGVTVASNRLGADARITALTVILLCTLTGCSGGGEPADSATNAAISPSTTSTASPVPSSDDATTTAVPETPTELPSCDAVFTAAGFAIIAANSLTSNPVDPAPGGLGDFDRIIPPLRAIATGNESVTCSFILPASERGMVIAIVRIAPADRAAIVAGLAGAGYSTIASGTLNPGDNGFSLTVTGDYPFTEAHVLSHDTWVSCFDYFGQAATNYAIDATGRIAGSG